MYDDFYADLSYGINYENKLKNILLRIFKTKWETIEYDGRIEDEITDKKDLKKYDVRYKIGSKLLKIELKTEKNFTGNLYLMYHKYGKDGGIFTSKSHLYVFYFEDLKKLYMCKTEELKEKINEWKEDKEYDRYHKVLKNHKNDNKAYCLNITHLREELTFFKEYDLKKYM